MQSRPTVGRRSPARVRTQQSVARSTSPGSANPIGENHLMEMPRSVTCPISNAHSGWISAFNFPSYTRLNSPAPLNRQSSKIRRSSRPTCHWHFSHGGCVRGVGEKWRPPVSIGPPHSSDATEPLISDVTHFNAPPARQGAPNSLNLASRTPGCRPGSLNVCRSLTPPSPNGPPLPNRYNGETGQSKLSHTRRRGHCSRLRQ